MARCACLNRQISSSMVRQQGDVLFRALRMDDVVSSPYKAPQSRVGLILDVKELAVLDRDAGELLYEWGSLFFVRETTPLICPQVELSIDRRHRERHRGDRVAYGFVESAIPKDVVTGSASGIVRV